MQNKTKNAVTMVTMIPGAIVMTAVAVVVLKELLLSWYILFDLLVGRFGARVKDATREVLDEADALSDPYLLLLRQLGGQAGLTGCGVVHRYLYMLLDAHTHTHLLQKNPENCSTLTQSVSC